MILLFGQEFGIEFTNASCKRYLAELTEIYVDQSASNKRYRVRIKMGSATKGGHIKIWAGQIETNPIFTKLLYLSRFFSMLE